MKTRSGIYYDLSESNFLFVVEPFVLVFSSALNKIKFKNQIKEFIKENNEKILKKYGIECNTKYVSSLLLYQKIEHRGFYVIWEKHDGTQIIMTDKTKIQFYFDTVYYLGDG